MHLSDQRLGDEEEGLGVQSRAGLHELVREGEGGEGKGECRVERIED